MSMEISVSRIVRTELVLLSVLAPSNLQQQYSAEMAELKKKTLRAKVNLHWVCQGCNAMSLSLMQTRMLQDFEGIENDNKSRARELAFHSCDINKL